MFAGRCYHFIQSERLKLFYNVDSGIILLITFDLNDMKFIQLTKNIAICINKQVFVKVDEEQIFCNCCLNFLSLNQSCVKVNNVIDTFSSICLTSCPLISDPIFIF